MISLAQGRLRMQHLSGSRRNIHWAHHWQ
jgi:hypothetical protein